jgi:hypothetical protein
VYFQFWTSFSVYETPEIAQHITSHHTARHIALVLKSQIMRIRSPVYEADLSRSTVQRFEMDGKSQKTTNNESGSNSRSKIFSPPREVCTPENLHFLEYFDDRMTWIRGVHGMNTENLEHTNCWLSISVYDAPWRSNSQTENTRPNLTTCNSQTVRDIDAKRRKKQIRSRRRVFFTEIISFFKSGISIRKIYPAR